MKRLLYNYFRFFLVLIIIIKSMSVQCQYPDATILTSADEYYTLLTNNLTDERSTVFDSSRVGLSLITMHFFTVNTVEGDNEVTLANVNNSLSKANHYFKPAGIQFQRGTFDSIPEYPYGYFSKTGQDMEMLVKYARKNTINLFLVDSIIFDSIDYYGFTWFPDDKDSNFIILRKDHLGTGALVTQLGHFFGLLTTSNYISEEYVDGTNCGNAGDYICDTHADRGIFGQVNSSCEFVGAAMDSHNDWLVPSVANFMAEGPFECKCIFTPEQYRRIVYYYKNYRSYLR